MAAVTRIPIPAWQKVQNHDDRLDLPVSELDLPVRVINFLEDDGIFTVGQLLHCTNKKRRAYDSQDDHFHPGQDRLTAPLAIRNAAVPAAGFGSNAGMLLVILGAIFQFGVLLWLGIILFSAVVFFQVVNLPVEFDASNRAKAQLVSLGIVSREELVYVRKVLDAAALTYVAATLQAIMTLIYLIMRYGGSRR